MYGDQHERGETAQGVHILPTLERAARRWRVERESQVALSCVSDSGRRGLEGYGCVSVW